MHYLQEKNRLLLFKLSLLIQSRKKALKNIYAKIVVVAKCKFLKKTINN